MCILIMERLNNIRLSQEISVQVHSLQEYLNTKLLLVLQIFKATCSCILFVAISVLTQILQLNTKPKGKEKDKEMFKYSLFSFRSGAFFPHRLSIGLLLNRRTLAATALFETYNILIVKKYYQFIVFFRNINSVDSRKVETKT